MKRIAVITDLSGLGRCSLSAALPVLSVMGHECVALPTAVLSAQTGFEHGCFIRDLTGELSRFTDSFDKIGVGFDAILSGFLTCREQVEEVSAFVDRFKGDNTVFVCDPVLGDDGELYPVFDADMAGAMKRLCLKADIITPNLTELGLMCGVSRNELMSMSDSGVALAATACFGSRTAVVTGIKKDGRIGELIVEGAAHTAVETPYIGGSYSGTGDLFSSVLCGGILQGLSVREASAKASEFIYKSVKDTAAEGADRNYGVNFERHLEELL